MSLVIQAVGPKRLMILRLKPTVISSSAIRRARRAAAKAATIMVRTSTFTTLRGGKAQVLDAAQLEHFGLVIPRGRVQETRHHASYPIRHVITHPGHHYPEPLRQHISRLPVPMRHTLSLLLRPLSLSARPTSPRQATSAHSLHDPDTAAHLATLTSRSRHSGPATYPAGPSTPADSAPQLLPALASSTDPLVYTPRQP